MGKVIRPIYPAEFSIGLMLLIFIILSFLSSQIFNVPFLDLHQNKHVFFGMALAGLSVVIMILIIWEEFLFPITEKAVDGGFMYRNHGTKLKTQLRIYCFIPTIYAYIYFQYEINHIRFFIWAGVCILTPVIEKIFSGINNYNDFLRLTDKEIDYKNNEKEGCYKVKDVQSITSIKDERNIIKKIQLVFNSGENLIIDLDEMELEAFYGSINTFINTNYSHLLKQAKAANITN